jgi:adenylosuccinate synthase
MSVCAVVGGQFGSEGKGLIVGHIARQYDHHVRVGAANAGHTLYTRRWWQADDLDEPENRYEKHVMQQIPCAGYANPEAILYIGAGAVISPEILGREWEFLRDWRRRRNLPVPQLRVDPRAHVVREVYKVEEAKWGLSKIIGSTSGVAREGIGAAHSHRIQRYDYLDAGTYFDEENHDYPFIIDDVAWRLRYADSILLEGTQGVGLDLIHGMYPYVTSRHTTAAGLCADVGIPPTRLDRIVLVVRTFPIRVANNSGPFWDGSEETTWEKLGVDPESERTTVTKKIRRVATFSMQQVVDAVNLCGATEIALTFCDYIDPTIRDVRERIGLALDYTPVWRQVIDIEQVTGVPVTMLGTGPHSVIDRR